MTAGGSTAGANAPTQLGPYQLRRRLGEGGMGVVHLGVDAAGREVAVKVLRAHIAHDPQARARLAREVSALRRVQHRLVADVIDANVEGDQPYLVTRFVPGPGLDAVVKEQGPLSPGSLLRLGRGLSGALSAIHAVSVVHRDLKPANVLMLNGDPVVIDFGIAHVADDARMTSTGLVMGTPGYLSPEVIDGDPVTEATDWWGWAATLAFAATGRPPFGRGPMHVVIDRVRRGSSDLAGVDERLRPLLAAALTAEPASRPVAKEVLDALNRYAVGESTTMTLAVSGPKTQVVSGSALVADAAPVTQAVQLSATRAIPETVPDTLVAPGVVTASGVAARPVPDAPPTQQVASDPTRLAPQRVRLKPTSATSTPTTSSVASAVVEPSPISGRSPDRLPTHRSGAVAGLLVTLVGLAASFPTLAAVLTVGMLVIVRTVERNHSSLSQRQLVHGRRRRDGVIAVLSAPWHLVRAVFFTGLAALIPVVVGAAVAVTVSKGQDGSSGLADVFDSVPAAAAGALAMLLMTWWGPGGAAVRRGTHLTLRGVVPSSAHVVVALVLVGAGSALAMWGWQAGNPDWGPVTTATFPDRG